ncbi:MAG: glucose-6-phosphate dehydrogenase [Rhodothermales bacterium]
MLQPHIYVVFGATGDLMQRKLLPALYDMYKDDDGNGPYLILGVSRSALSDEDFRSNSAASLQKFAKLEKATAEAWAKKTLFFQSIGKQEASDFEALAERLDVLEAEHDLPGNRVIYLSLPPSAFRDSIEKLAHAGLNTSEGWTRLVIEKPFGHDLESAQSLNTFVHQFYGEDQIYRIDHYLGKETVQNLLVFRFANAIFEPLWNRNQIERVDIVVTEDLGVGSRAGYYDKSGALRDMLQNHISQLLTLTAMEAPAKAEAASIRREKVKVLHSIREIDLKDVVRGQYTAGTLDGESVLGYLDEEGVPEDSTTETFVALRLFIDNWRWQGVPFVLQTGKRMPRRLTRIAVTFKRPPVSLFDGLDCNVVSNVLHITIQPDEGFSLGFEVKQPGSGYQARFQRLSYKYGEDFGELPDAYRTLLADVVRGDPTLFVHAEEVETAWAIYEPVLKQTTPIHEYEAGTYGPDAVNRLTRRFPIYDES